MPVFSATTTIGYRNGLRQLTTGCSAAFRAHAPALSVTLEVTSSRADLEVPRFYTIAQAASLCMRSEKTLRNLVSTYQVRTKTAWTVRRRLRRRVMTLDAASVAWLREITLFRNDAARQAGPPR